ncbi:UDP-N-acetylmuramoyl-L-alanyl-D-glutamate--L-lysine ligase [Paraliobacillus sp. PM-2]|uniref:UDP-N-acetylmuramoyl-L-alanyl-D-glutamate--2, 6-diaminopimelate ligase n=1 Tax=Paraliobacillus sp. PM-2 TaxID=1462524 RepID=UPI00061C59A3|nr:UDP-N-acetylmuramoyl-L-alanyl-D-glutamate--2,6-diaminopimelate ligase [Paraliobacillus sp. PM-2]CQR47794.1 UDP-N-acetylmuramoyl-L-alanyl-D-glutamate--L-lysine ligase [Paraliobacillus sp. PM-2]
MKQLIELLNTIPQYQGNKSIPSIEIKGITIDSRKVQQGYLFFCIEGYTVDGHDFVNQAIENGAVAVIAQKQVASYTVPVIYVKDTVKALGYIANAFYDYPTQRLELIGVTGTNGKTSVTNLINEMLQVNQNITGLIGTIEMKIANQSYPVANTTPEISFLQQSFKQMITEGVDTAIMEVSSHALELGRVNGCDFDIAVFTNLSQDHLDYHGTMNNYFSAKSRLFQQLGNTYYKDKPKYAVINVDDVYGPEFMHATVQPVITYGIDKLADVHAKNITLHASGSTFVLETFKGDIEINSKLMGKFSIYNMLAAASVALLKGISLTTIKYVLEHTSGVSGRFEPIQVGQSFGVIVDYAHTPDSLQNVLETIKEFSQGKIYVVVGCGGDRDKTKRPLMAEIACKYADQAVFTSDNPRSEDPQAILEDMIRNLNITNYQLEVDRKKAIEKTVALANGNDMILIAGKGHEAYQIIGNDTLPFDDREVAAEAINCKYL